MRARERSVLDGGLRSILAESLFMPTGLIAVVYLARRLGPEGYGLFALVFALLAPLEWLLAAPFAATTARRVRSAPDWRTTGLALAHRQALLGLIAATVVMVSASWFAALLNVPPLEAALRLFAIDLPLFALAQGYRDILIGRELHRARAIGNTARMFARPLLIVLGVEAGLGVQGAILGTIGVSVVQIVVCRATIRGPLCPRVATGVGLPPAGAIPRILAGLGLRLAERIDLLALASLGGSAATALIQGGIYATAQFLTLLPGAVALAFVPAVEEALRRHLRSCAGASARALARDTLRAAIAVWPFAALAAGAAPRLVIFLFGQPYDPAATPLALLIVAAAASILLLMTLTLLSACDRFGTAGAVIGAILSLAVVAYGWAIPPLGATGAALVAAATTALGALVGVIVAARCWHIRPPFATALRAAVLAAVAYATAHWWSVPLVLLPVQLGILMALIVAGLGVLGEWHPRDLARLRRRQ